MYVYAAKCEKDGDGVMVSFRDIPEALTGARNRQEALAMAADALATAMEFYFEDGRAVPVPSPARSGEVGIELSASLTAKVLLLNEMLAQEVTPSELARRLGTSPQSVNRIVTVSHATKIDTIADAMRALGLRLDFTVQRMS